MYRGCIFDLDGTLADTVVSIAYSANKTLEEMGLPPLPVENYKYYAGDGAAELVRRVLKDSGDTELARFQEMRERYRENFDRHCMYQVKPFEGIATLLEGLKAAGVKIAVLSNKPHPQAVKVVADLFGEGYFDAVQGQEEGIPRKPDPSGAKKLAAVWGIQPEECIYVGDTNTDMQTGKAAGMYTVGVLWGFRDRQELEENHGDLIVERPEEILELLVTVQPRTLHLLQSP